MDAYIANYWFNNLINNRINTEILLLVLPFNLKTNNLKRKKFKDRFSKLKTTNYEFVEISSIKSFNELPKNKNIIILGHSMMNVELLNNLEHCILCVSLLYRYEYFLSDIHIESIQKFTEEETGFHDNNLNFFKRRNPTFLLKNYDMTYKYVFGNLYLKVQPFDFIEKLFSHVYFCKYKGTTYLQVRDEVLDTDIFYLFNSHILTTRLAIFIYKITTYKLDDSNTRIGNYYRNKLGVKSKTVRLPKKYYKTNVCTVKAYDLTHYFNSESELSR